MNTIPDLNNYNLIPSFYFGISIPTLILIVYTLFIINISIFSVTIYLKLMDNYYENQYSKCSNKLIPILKNITDEALLIYEINSLKTNWNQDIVFKILTNYYLENNTYDISLFSNLGYISNLIEKNKKKLSLSDISWFGMFKVVQSIPILFKGVLSLDFEESFHCYQALAKIPMSKSARIHYLKLLFQSNILRDRMIEMILDMNLSLEQYLELLSLQDSELGKTVILRVISTKITPATNIELLKNMLPFLEDTKEVQIATINALSQSENNIFLDSFTNIYRSSDYWEVRSTIAKSMDLFSDEITLSLLKEMTKDSNWWVRFNSSEVLSRKGRAGLNILIDLSLDYENEESSKLAFSFLDANKNIHSTVLSNLKETND